MQGVRQATWDPVRQTYVTDGAVTQMQAGAGVWARADQPVQLQFGDAPVTDPFPVTLKPGWNLISAPFLTPVPWDLRALRVRFAGKETTLAGTTAAGWVNDYAWGWHQDAASNSGSCALAARLPIVPPAGAATLAISNAILTRV